MMDIDVQESILDQTDVSLSLSKHVISTHGEGKKNLVFSPLSIHVILSLIAAGSIGPTLDQFLSYLKAESTKQLASLFSDTVSQVLADGSPFGGPRLSFVNGAWVERRFPLKPSYQETVEKSYKAAITSVDFLNKAEEVRKEVNMWAEKETNGLIKEILPKDSVDYRTELVLGNAIYFKGAWHEKFYSLLTRDREFFFSNGSSVQAPFMTTKKKQYVRAFDGFKVLKLPYEQGGDSRCFSMCIFLPDVRDGLPSLVQKAGSEPGFVDRHLPYEKVRVGDFRIPKFKMAFGFEASDVLKELGLKLPFEPIGGLTEMIMDTDAGRPLLVSKIYHKAFIEVNEQGTEAAAVTVAAVGFGCGRMPLDFVADHPFLFVVREDMTGVVLFVGQLLDPLAAP